jgi:phosphonate transport system substrate-binding protein
MPIDRLRFGTFLAPNILPVYQAITDTVGHRLGIRADLVVETDYENCARDVNDICFVCSLPYVLYDRQGRAPAVPIAAPVLKGRRYGGRPIYFSDVIVRRDSPFRSFMDLRNHSWCYNEPLSQSGYGITRFTLLKRGETHGFFSQVVEAGFHEESIRLVLGGDIDGSAIDSQVLAVAMRANPALRRELRVIDTLGPSTIQPVAVSKRLPDDMRQHILRIMLSLHEDPAVRRCLHRGLISHFVPVGPKDYDDVRLMLQDCEAANFLTIQ